MVSGIGILLEKAICAEIKVWLANRNKINKQYLRFITILFDEKKVDGKVNRK
ncbi:MAG: hypothetical protein ACJAYJ_004406 [Saprospiraceae bacterium]